MMVPSLGQAPRESAERYAAGLDGLVLQGGVDLSPRTYGMKPLTEIWPGDEIRDAHELELLRAFISRGKPVLGICRGAQLINAAFSGTLFQDIATELPTSISHRDMELFDLLRHDILIKPGTPLARLYPGLSQARTNSLHHQAIDRLGTGLVVEARAVDGVIEAIRWTGGSYVFGVQWHPEWHPLHEPEVLSGEPILEEFMQAARGKAWERARERDTCSILS
jgi:putative glutamine amidotransferase